MTMAAATHNRIVVSANNIQVPATVWTRLVVSQKHSSEKLKFITNK